jgi:hypothetical protein
LSSKSNVRSGWIGTLPFVLIVIRNLESGEHGVWSAKLAFVKYWPPVVTSKQIPYPLLVKPQ